MKWMRVFMVLGLLTLCNSARAEGFDPCKDTIEHKPRADVNYNPSPVGVPDTIKFPLTIDMAERYGIDVPAGMEMNVVLGDIEIDADGHVFYNNQDITSDIKDKCDNDTGEFEAIIEQQSQNGDNTDTRR